jgi:RNA polymerase sigma factor (sigma-70 family)
MTTADFQHQIILLSDYINGFALKYTRNKENAQDLAQETILRAFLNRDKFRTNTNLKGWITVMMRNIFINGVRKKSYRMINFNSDDFRVMNGEQDDYSPMDELVKNQIDEAIFNLKEDVREPFQLHIEGFKYKEIAETLDIPIGTVKSRVFMARKILANQINR